MIPRRPLLSTFILLLAFLVSGSAASAEDKRQRYANRPDDLFPFAKVKIYKDLYTKRIEYKGSGRDLPEPEVDSVKIGFIGPLEEEDGPIVPEGFRAGPVEPSKALFGKHLLLGALLAVEEANHEEGYRGKPFELVKRTDLVQWGQTSNELAKFAYEDKVWAILSGIDSNHSHVLNRATLKAEVPLVNAGSTDPTLTEHSIPWLIRCMNDDRLNAYELLSYIHQEKGWTRIALLRVNDRDGRVGVEEFIKGARRLEIPVRLELRFSNGDTDFSSQLEHIRQLNPEVVVILGNPPEAAGILKQMRDLQMGQQVLGFDRLANPYFLELAGEAAEGVVVASTFNPDRADPIWQSFRSRYRQRFDSEPDAFAAHAYDGTRLIIEAVRSAGLNRVRIRDWLYSLHTFPGVTGEIQFDRNMNDLSRPWLARVEGGQLQYFRAPSWDRNQQFEVQIESETGD